MALNFKSLMKSRTAQIGEKFIANVGKHDLLTLAGALAFNTALSLAPLVLIFLTCASLLGPNSQDRLLQQVQDFLGPQAAEAIKAVVASASNKPTLGSIAGVFGVLMLLISASSVFAQLQSSLNVIWETDEAKSAGVWGWLRKRLLSMGMVLALGFVAAVSLVLSSVISIVSSQGALWQALNTLVSLSVFTLLFALIFAYLPDVKLPFRRALEGGLLTAVLFSIGKLLISLYISKSAVSSSYGAAGSLVVLLIWVYYSSFILFAGAELTRVLVPESELKTDTALKPEASKGKVSRPVPVAAH